MSLYQFVMHSDKKREKWKFMPVSEVEKLPQRPMFTTALKLTCDPRAISQSNGDAEKLVKYIGPMHFDLDNASDIPATLKSGRELFEKLQTELGVPAKYISIFLSGKKGLHFTIPESVFGITKPVALLPLVWKYVAERMKVDDLDMGIYSMGRGRMWRNANVERKEHTYKVPVSAQELENMTEEQYLTLVAAPREEFVVEDPGNFVSSAAVKMYKAGMQHARAVVKKSKEASAQALDNADSLPEVPGCIDQLITRGDCEESNYNQACMQLATWIAARFERKDEQHYTELLIDPFLENVTSATRSSLHERKEHLNEQLNRAFKGEIVFSRGALIKTIGMACHNCPICRPDLLEEGKDKDDDGDKIDPVTRISEKSNGYFRITVNSSTQLTSFTLKPKVVYNELRFTESGPEESGRKGFIVDLVDENGLVFHDMRFPEESWLSRTNMIRSVDGRGTAILLCSDADLSAIQLAMMRFYPLESLDMKTYTETCGVYLEKLNNGKAIKPHYVEANESVTSMGMPSRFFYTGERAHVPMLMEQLPLSSGDTEAEECIANIAKMNEKHSIAAILGWLASNYFREHINNSNPEYPSINVAGNSGSGKSATTRLLCKLSGLDYSRAGCEPLNMESATMVPLFGYLSNSTTVVRLVEEANETQMSRKTWNGWTNILKSSWDRTSVSRGTLSSHGSKGPGRIDYRISAPLMFISEQKPTRPSVVERCISVVLSKRGRKDKECRPAFSRATETSDSLMRMGRSLLNMAMTSDPAEFTKPEIERRYGHFVAEGLDDRPRYAYQVVFLGLCKLKEAFEAAKLSKGAAVVEELTEALRSNIEDNRVVIAQSKRTSECDLVLRGLNSLAASKPDLLRPGIHYRRSGNELSLSLDLVMPQYIKYCREMGLQCPFTSTDSFGDMLQSEDYFDRVEPDEETHMLWYVLNLGAVRIRAIPFSFLREG